ncbi:MAG: caspase family protein [Chloroflexales bacterium]|nr:caspase family protein [Chloroflexales bacterium]
MSTAAVPSAAKGKGAETADVPFVGTGQHWAVLVGVNHYDDPYIRNLTVCSDDVAAIHQTLAPGYAVARLLTDTTPEQLTRANVLAALAAMAEAAADDLLLFSFSGHGVAEGGESYLLPCNDRLAALKYIALALSDLRAILDQSPARAKVIVLDACHSSPALGKAPPEMTPEFIRRVFAEAEGMATLASRKQGQRSWEWSEQWRSAFTYYLLEALHGRADFDGKGFVTVTDANRYVTDRLKAWAAERGLTQTPTFQYATAGDIVLCRLWRIVAVIAAYLHSR